MPGLDYRVIEVIGRITRQADALHDASRALVQRHGECDNLFKCQLLESEPHRRRGRFRRVPLSPMFAREAPPNFNAGSEPRFGQAHESDEGCAGPNLDGPESPTALLNELVRAGHRGITFFAGQAAGEMPHHHRVRVESRERLPVRGPPLPENQAFGDKKAWHY